jgi:hypothetical protein
MKTAAFPGHAAGGEDLPLKESDASTASCKNLSS